MGFKVSDVSAGVAANLAVFDEDELDNETEDKGPLGLSRAEYFGGAEIGGASGGKHHYDGEDRGHDHAAELSDTGNTVFNYSMRDRMDGDGGTTNKIGYRNFSPVAAEELDGSERRRKEADERLHIILEQYEASQRLAEIDARLRELDELRRNLEDQINQLDVRINAHDRILDLMDDSDLNADTLSALARRNELRQALTQAGLDPNEYFRADGSVDQDKLEQDRQLIEEGRVRADRERRAAQDRLDRVKDEMNRLRSEQEQILKAGRIPADLLQRQASRDPEAQAELREIARTDRGAVEVLYTIQNNSDGLDVEAKTLALMQVGPAGGALDSDAAQVLAQNTDSDAAWDAAANVPDTTPTVTFTAPFAVAEAQPEASPGPVQASLDTNMPAFITPVTMAGDAGFTGTERTNGSLAAELGFDTVSTGGIKPITATFAQAVQPAGQQVAALDNEAALAANERQRLPAGTSGAQFGTSGMA